MKMRSTSLPPTEAHFKGSKERIVGANGEINAGNKKELIARLAEVLSGVQSGALATPASESKHELIKQHRETVDAAYHDKDGRSWAELGSAIAADLAEVGNREGFARNLLQRVDVPSGGVPQIDVKQLNTVAVVAVSPSTIVPQFLRNKKLFPPEFEVIANTLIDERDINQGPADILAQKFIESQQQIQVQEDKLTKTAFDALIGAQGGNTQQIFSGSFTPTGLGTLFQSIQSHNLQPTNIIMASDAYSDVLTNSNFSTWFDPVSQYEIVTTGYVGRLMGMNVRTEAYKEPSLRVLNQGEIYVTAAPEYTGAITDRGPVQSKEVPTNRAARGWFMWEIISLTVHNPRAVAKGVRS
jgi:hypothetical protein